MCTRVCVYALLHHLCGLNECICGTLADYVMQMRFALKLAAVFWYYAVAVKSLLSDPAVCGIIICDRAALEKKCDGKMFATSGYKFKNYGFILNAMLYGAIKNKRYELWEWVTIAAKGKSQKFQIKIQKCASHHDFHILMSDSFWIDLKFLDTENTPCHKRYVPYLNISQTVYLSFTFSKYNICDFLLIKPKNLTYIQQTEPYAMTEKIQYMTYMLAKSHTWSWN